MAKNLLDKALNLLGLKPSTAIDYYDPSVYKAEVITTKPPSEISSTEKFQQKKNVSSKNDKKLSGVAKYLAEKQQAGQEKIMPEVVTPEKLTGVAKYLATKQADERLAFDNMTGVAKYLYNLKTNNKTQLETSSLEKEETVVKLSRVDMYLAKKQGVKLESKAKTVSANNSIVVPAATQKASADDAINEKKITQSIHNKLARVIEKPENKLIDRAAGAAQCQAATLKHTQCSRTTSLEIIEQTINGQVYKFTVCSQHNKDSFVPFAQFL